MRGTERGMGNNYGDRGKREAKVRAREKRDRASRSVRDERAVGRERVRVRGGGRGRREIARVY